MLDFSAAPPPDVQLSITLYQSLDISDRIGLVNDLLASNIALNDSHSLQVVTIPMSTTGSILRKYPSFILGAVHDLSFLFQSEFHPKH